MSIKNPDIRHLIVKGRYLCIRSCIPTKEKSTRDKKMVNCVNCKGLIRRKK